MGPHRARRASQREHLRCMVGPLKLVPRDSILASPQHHGQPRYEAEESETSESAFGLVSTDGTYNDPEGSNASLEQNGIETNQPLSISRDESSDVSLDVPRCEDLPHDRKGLTAKQESESSTQRWGDPEKPLAMVQSVDSTSTLRSSSTGSTVYHIYHTGKTLGNYSIHRIPDKDIVLPQVDDPSAPNYIDDPDLRAHKPGHVMRALRSIYFGCGRRPQIQDGIRQIKRWRCVDEPKYDTRTATSPYFVHRPYLSFHLPPYTLRRGGHKAAPTICLFHPSFFWRHYDITFADELAREDVIDPRGVVREDFGARDGENHGIKGYKVRSWRLWGETGKQYHRDVNKERKDRETDKSVEKASLQDDEQDVSPNSNEARKPIAGPIEPNELLRLTWKSPFRSPREYHFNFRGIDFYWKGTATVKDEKVAGIALAFCHLKLVALLPSKSSASDEKSNLNKTLEEVCLAKYTSLVARRKSGRLEVYDGQLNKIVREHLSPKTSTPAEGEDLRDEKAGIEAEQTFQRFQDVVMTTAMCMIISEDHKREALAEIFWEIVDAASNGGG
ncbi:MAG: hypothetical protein M4579_005189 [Chaenotheca gracillima]|nr:MAG: hypothetical protein M4579_005189 [Chaenotheca gracillima]